MSAILTAALAVLCCLPGLVLVRGKTGIPGLWAASATASVALCLLVTALAGIALNIAGIGPLPAIALVPASLFLCILAWLFSQKEQAALPRPEWQGLAYAAAMAGFSVIALALATHSAPGGELWIHGYYNADGFKHLGNVHALANYGIPARDAFGGGEPLHYYWLLYILPGAGTALGGNAWAAMATANAVVCVLFALTFYGAARLAASSANIALAAVAIGTLVSAPMIHAARMVSGMPLSLLMEEDTPEPALMMIPQVIPQHALVLALLLGWAVVAIRAPEDRQLNLFALAGLAASMTISTLVGAMCLAAYGLFTLWNRKEKALVELAVMAVVSSSLVLALDVVSSGSASGATTSEVAVGDPWYLLAVTGVLRLAGMVGAPIFLVVLTFRHWASNGETEMARRLVICLLAAAFIMVMLTQAALSDRLSIEFLIRARLIVAIAVALFGAWALSEAWRRGGKTLRTTWLLIGALIVLAAPAALVRTAWLHNFGDRFTTVIPADDMQVLAVLREQSDPQAQVWQYPEPPKSAQPRGDDMWAVPIAGRTVPNSTRATDRTIADPYIALSQRFFLGEDDALPALVDWVYLSRALHPESYDVLATAMRAKPGWQEVTCPPNACLFRRSVTVSE